MAFVILQSIESDLFSLPESAARQSGLIEQMLSSECNNTPKVIVCPTHSTVLAKLARFLTNGMDLLEEDSELIVDLMIASDFLDNVWNEV